MLPEIENKSPEIKKTAFRRRLQRPRVNKRMATNKSADAAVKQAILGADRSKNICDSFDIEYQQRRNLTCNSFETFF